MLVLRTVQRHRRTGVLLVLGLGLLCAVLFLHAPASPHMVRLREARSLTTQPPNALYSYDFEWRIFITPAPFTDNNGRLQRRAIQSWQRLNPRPSIVLVGTGEGYDEVAAEFGLLVDPQLDTNFVNMPLAGSLLDRATRGDTEISVIINSDVLLTQSFADALAKARTHFQDWFLTGARYDLDDLPPIYEFSRPDFSEPAFINYVKTKAVLHTAGGADYFAWNNNRGKRLIQGHMPPFIRGKSKFDNWFVHEVIQAGYRDVVDATESVTAVHVVHNYQSVDGKVSFTNSQSGSTFWQKAKSSNWMIFHNIHLAIHYGSYRNQDGTTLHAPWKLAGCMEAGGMCLIKRLRPGVCPCEHNAFALSTQNDPEVVSVFENDVRKNLVKCGGISVDKSDAYDIAVVTEENHPPKYGLPFTLKDLLPLVARDNHVVLTGVSIAYKELLMSWVCNLRRLGLNSGFVVAAFDEETYRFAFRMGVPAFYYQSGSMRAMAARDMVYGSEGFKTVTKLKSQIVLQILELGYDVTWTDTDIVWLQNPIPALQAMPSDFVVQSNAPWPEEARANGPLRINSGFYRVRSTPVTVKAMQSIVAHAATSRLTEQPSFYIILCGGKEGANVVGPDKCRYTPPPLSPQEQQQHLQQHPQPPNQQQQLQQQQSQQHLQQQQHGDEAGGLVHHAAAGDPADDAGNEQREQDKVLEVQFLDRQLYPNGAVGKFWELKDIRSERPDMMILHDNWIRGLRAKIRRMIDHNLWYWNREKEICDYSPKPKFDLDWNVEDLD
eukprot:m.143482 g.143482  ORF g.143482 m.143482 type:complete len:775 (-) comp20434_c0_seq2:60-2384(-)